MPGLPLGGSLGTLWLLTRLVRMGEPESRILTEVVLSTVLTGPWWKGKKDNVCHSDAGTIWLPTVFILIVSILFSYFSFLSFIKQRG